MDITLILKTQEAPVAMVAFLSVSVESPAANGFPLGPVTEALAPQLVFHPDGSAGVPTTTLVGNESKRESCANELALSLFLIVIDSTLFCPAQTVVGAKILLRVGA